MRCPTTRASSTVAPSPSGTATVLAPRTLLRLSLVLSSHSSSESSLVPSGASSVSSPLDLSRSYAVFSTSEREEFSPALDNDLGKRWRLIRTSRGVDDSSAAFAASVGARVEE
ncbi:hypothetical protein ACGC1H_003721 [Rhizoctonia solani]